MTNVGNKWEGVYIDFDNPFKLENKNIIVNIRRSRGKDIDAACGQLANKNKAIKKTIFCI